jgi:hypothetical protein
VIRAARRHRIEVPVTEAMYALLKLVDPGFEEAAAERSPTLAADDVAR